jgi:membrane-bound metal-dependent hydrolase YbcI (DUF457 family)
MFIGHFAVGFAAKRWAPRQSLAVLLLAPLLADVLWPVFVLFGVERFRIAPGATAFNHFVFDAYPWSHSLLMLGLWGGLAGLLVRGLTGDRRGALVVALAVVSHWVLDWATHVRDMPLWPGGPRLGLGLWNSVPGTLTVELSLFVPAVWLYATVTRARDRVGRLAFASLVTLLAAAFVLDPRTPPPGRLAVVIPGIVASAITVLWAQWIERHREVAGQAPAG